MLDSLFNEVAGKPATLLKRDSNTGVFLRILRKFLRPPILKNICKRLLLSEVELEVEVSQLIRATFAISKSRYASNAPTY